MKNIVKASLCLCLVVCLMVSLVACGGIAGRYNLMTMTNGTDTMDAETVKSITGFDGELYIELFDNGTAVMSMFGTTTDLEYDDNYLWPASDKEDTMPYRIEGSSLILEQEGVKVVFKK